MAGIEKTVLIIEKVKSKSRLITDKSELSNPARYGDNRFLAYLLMNIYEMIVLQKITRQNRLLKRCLNSQSIDQKIYREWMQRFFHYGRSISS